MLSSSLGSHSFAINFTVHALVSVISGLLYGATLAMPEHIVVSRGSLRNWRRIDHPSATGAEELESSAQPRERRRQHQSPGPRNHPAQPHRRGSTANGLFSALALAAALLSGCETPHGLHHAGANAFAANDILEFSALFSANCAGCHGANGHGSAAIALANPVYLAIVDTKSIRNVIANGVPGTAMPAFAENVGGSLTDRQIDLIAAQIRGRWSKPGVLDGANPPRYAAKSPGDPRRGHAAYKTYCESCHGADGRGGPKGSSITDDSFLALVSDQGLRTVVIVGRPELGAPDWRGNVRDKIMSDQEVTDVVAWLTSHRPHPGANYLHH